jgi:hypothetical protein
VIGKSLAKSCSGGGGRGVRALRKFPAAVTVWSERPYVSLLRYVFSSKEYMPHTISSAECSVVQAFAMLGWPLSFRIESNMSRCCGRLMLILGMSAGVSAVSRALCPRKSPLRRRRSRQRSWAMYSLDATPFGWGNGKIPPVFCSKFRVENGWLLLAFGTGRSRQGT